jgi:signal transduction histidine kinase
VKLIEHVDDNLPEVLMDVDRLKQVMLNLQNNALDAMPDGGELEILVAKDNDEITIRVVDTGIGIAPDQLPLIFEPFFTSKGLGTGLGLAISYNIISDRGGEIEIESKLGEGTTVLVSLPVNPVR